MKELSLTDKDLLRKKLESHTRTFRLLCLPFLIAAGLSFLAFRQGWVAADFPPYLALVCFVLLVALLFFLAEIIKIRKAIAGAGKTVVAGRISKKIKSCDEYSTEYFLVVRGKKYEVESQQFDAFREGDHVKLELAVSGQELISIKKNSRKLLFSRAYRKARIQAKRLRR